MSGHRPSRRIGLLPLWAAVAAGLVAAVAVVSLGAAFFLTSGPGFLGGYSGLKRSHATLQSSAHRGIDCGVCHVDPRGTAVAKVARVADFYRGLLGKPKEPRFGRLPRPTREACLKCHGHDWSMEAERTRRIPHPAHLRVADEKRDCVTCHRWTAHEEEYMDKHEAMRFSSVCASFGCHVGTKPASACADCHHSLQKSSKTWRVGHRDTVRSAGPNSCLEVCHEADQCRLCHTTGKRPDFGSSAAPTGVQAIEREHVKRDWVDRHGPMARADESKCFVCHVSSAECEDCHAKRPAFHGLRSTWLGRHKEPGKDRQRCLACHEAASFCEPCHDQFKEMR